MKKLLTLAAVAIVALTMAGCDPAKESTGDIRLKTPAKFEIGAAATTLSISATASTPIVCNVTEGTSWLSIEPLQEPVQPDEKQPEQPVDEKNDGRTRAAASNGGNGEPTSVTELYTLECVIAVAENTGGVRKGQITLVSDAGKVTVAITQAAATNNGGNDNGGNNNSGGDEPVHAGGLFTVKDYEITFAPEGGSHDLVVLLNVDGLKMTATVRDGNWVSSDCRSTDTKCFIPLRALPNYSAEHRRAILIIRGEHTSGACQEAVIHLSQPGGAAYTK